MTKSKKAGEEIVTLDRRANDRRADERRTGDRRGETPSELQVKQMIAKEKRKSKVQRRRQIDPTTCERDYSGDEIEFMAAMDEYKRKNGRMFPTCSEILEVIRSLGYERSERSATIATATAQDDIDEESSSSSSGDECVDCLTFSIVWVRGTLRTQLNDS